MSILAGYIRPVDSVGVAVCFNILKRRIHHGKNIRIPCVYRALALHRTVGLHRFHPLVCFLEVHTVARLVAERIECYRRMVLALGIHAARAVEMSREPLGEVGKRFLAIAHAV